MTKINRYITFSCTLALSLLVFGGCGEVSDQAPSCDDTYSAQDGTRWVSAVCGTAGSDGTSKAKPAATLADALKTAVAGDVVLVGAGVYAGGVTVPAGVDVIGLSADAVVISGGAGVRVAGAGATTLAQLTVDKAEGVGLWIEGGGKTTLRESVVTATQSSADFNGDGVWVRGSQFVLDGSSLTFNAGAGLVVMGNDAKVAIVDPIWKASPAAQAIVDPIWEPSPDGTSKTATSVIEGNTVGVAIVDPIWIVDPVWIVDPIWQPEGSGASAFVGAATFMNNEVGVSAFGGDLQLDAAVIKAGAGVGIYAAGVAEGGPTVRIGADTSVSGAGDSVGAWFQERADVTAEASFSGQGQAAIWADGAVKLSLKGCSFSSLGGLAVALRNGADLTADAIEVKAVKSDGVQIIDGSSALITNSKFSKIERTAVLIDSPAIGDNGKWKVKMKGNEFTDCKAGCTVNGKSHKDYGASAEGNKANNAYAESVDTAVKDGGDLSWDAEACDGKCAAPKSPKVLK